MKGEHLIHRYILHLTLICVISWMTIAYPTQAQSVLDRTVRLHIQQQPLKVVIDSIGVLSDIRFSYPSRILPSDSLVSVDFKDNSIREVLTILLDSRYEFLPIRNHVIIRFAPFRMQLEASEVKRDDRFYTIQGVVKDAETGNVVVAASVYERDLLLSAITDASGMFNIRVRTREPKVTLIVTKELYTDAALVMQLDGITINADSTNSTGINQYSDHDSDRIERSFLGRIFVPNRLRIMSQNLRGFLLERPYQVSLTPGLSTHGMMSGQVVDKVSINLIGGYTAGIEGFEVAGAFNLNKGDVSGIQVAGVFNKNGGNLDGVQLSGAYNHAAKSVSGAQVAGVANHTNKAKGIQIAGLINKVDSDMRGVQLSGFLNKARYLRGMQIGVVNIADSLDGAVLGVVNIIRKNGVLNLSVAADESVNLVFRSGTKRLYTILLAGSTTASTDHALLVGYGLGTQFRLNEKWHISPEATWRDYFIDSDSNDHLSKLDVLVHRRLWGKSSIYFGPSLNIWYSNRDEATPDLWFLNENRRTYQKIGDGALRGWVGATIGIGVF